MSHIGSTSGVGIATWRQVGRDSGDRIVLDRGRPLVRNLASFLSGWMGRDNNKNSGLALRAAVVPDLDPQNIQIVDSLLNKTIVRREKLTARDVALAVQVHDNAFGGIIAKYDNPNELFSPRAEKGEELHEDVLKQLKRSIRDPDLAGMPLAVKIGTIIDTVKTAQVAHDNTREKIVSVLNGIKSCCMFSDACKSSTNDYLRHMTSPLKNAYAFVIDMRFYDQGMFYFENERGFLSGAVSALTKMVETLGEPLTAESYKQLHDLAVDQVHKRDKIGSNDIFAQGYRTNGVMFALNPGKNSTEQGLAEFKISTKASAGWIEVRGSGSDRDYSHGYLLAKSATPKRCEAKVTEIIDQYHDAMARLPLDATDDAKLENIARLCQDLDQHHVFSDGNIRTVYIVLNKCLLENGMSPTLLEDPNCIDMHSIAEIVDKIKAGQVLFETHLAPPPSIIV